MKFSLKTQKGYSLVELIVTLPLAAIVFAGISLALIHFISVFQEAKLYTQLQEDLFTAVETMKQGYSIEQYTAHKPLIGLSAAKSVVLSETSNMIKVVPALAQEEGEIVNYWSEYSCDSNGELWVYSSHGLGSTFKKPIKVFPSTPLKRVGKDPQFQITNKGDIWKIIKKDGNDNPTLIRIRLEAQVRFRERQRNQTTEDDIRQNTRSIKYETSVFIGNVSA